MSGGSHSLLKALRLGLLTAVLGAAQAEAGSGQAPLPQVRGACALDRLDIRGSWGQASFAVEIADDDAERALGLMHRDSIASSQAMLFVYPQAGTPPFWMKNTLIPLDMVFITPAGVVQHVHANAVPGDLTPISGGPGVIAVLEIQGGLAARLGIAPGSQIRAPAFDGASAAWPCD